MAVSARPLVVIVALFATNAAWATGGECPAAFDTDDCDVSGFTVCEETVNAGPDQIYCDFQDAPSASTATIVWGYGGGGYSAWGTYGTAKFCCHFTTDVVGFDEIKIHGSIYNDTFKYTYTGGYELEHAGYTLAAYIDGDEGDDTIVGSNATTSYTEYLEGYDGDDTILGGAGNDYIWGQDDDDILNGGAGDDHIRGGNQSDTIKGGDGNDTLDGDQNDDFISGGNGNDTIDSIDASGLDSLCGDGNGDILYSSAGNGDKLYGASTADEVHCADTNAWIDTLSTPFGSCTTSNFLTTRPATCPF